METHFCEAIETQVIDILTELFVKNACSAAFLGNDAAKRFVCYHLLSAGMLFCRRRDRYREGYIVGWIKLKCRSY